jgi:hypothetical protein
MLDLIISAIGVGLTAAGTISQMSAQDNLSAAQQKAYGKQAQLSKEAALITKQQEDLRRQQMNYNAAKAKREIIRNAQMARSLSLTAASSQGGQFSTGYLGSTASISAQEAEQRTSLRQNYMLGKQNFALNAQLTDLQALYNSASGGLNRAQSQYTSDSQQNQALIQAGQSLVQYTPQLTNTASGMTSLFKV